MIPRYKMVHTYIFFYPHKTTKKSKTQIYIDISFLETIQNKINISKRDPLINKFETKEQILRKRELIKVAKAKKVRIFFQPKLMSKHSINKTYITPNNNKDNKNKKNDHSFDIIHWTLSIKLNQKEFIIHEYVYIF